MANYVGILAGGGEVWGSAFPILKAATASAQPPRLRLRM